MAEAAPHDSLEEADARTMLYWLGRRLRELRKAKGVSVSSLVQWVEGQGRGHGKPLDAGTVSNFETGKSWPRALDGLIAAYAAECGYEDGRKLWEEALANYMKFGGAPLPTRWPSSADRAVQLALEAARRKKPYAA
jgi:hypothetical protein